MRFAKTLQPGDLIVVSYGRYLRHAIFSGRGKSGNAQFYLLPFYKDSVDTWSKYYILESIKAGKKPWRNYITSSGEERIAKVNMDDLRDEDRDAYIGIVNVLKKNNYIQ